VTIAPDFMEPPEQDANISPRTTVKGLVQVMAITKAKVKLTVPLTWYSKSPGESKPQTRVERARIAWLLFVW
jgi:hypothetical protein